MRDPVAVMREMERVLAPGGHLHVVTLVAEGWRTGPTATLSVFVLEYAKLLFPWRAWRMIAHGVLGWLLFPLRYLDLILLKRPEAGRLGNHCYIWYRK